MNKDKEEATLLLVEMVGNFVGAVTGYARHLTDADRKRAEELINDFNDKAVKLKRMIENL